MGRMLPVVRARSRRKRVLSLLVANASLHFDLPGRPEPRRHGWLHWRSRCHTLRGVTVSPLQRMLGKRLLAGITYLDEDGAVRATSSSPAR